MNVGTRVGGFKTFDSERSLAKAMHALLRLQPFQTFSGLPTTPLRDGTALFDLPEPDLACRLADLPGETFKGRRINPAVLHQCKALVARFESFGNNCEFGFVQRVFAAEPLDLFRFFGGTPAGLISALETGFAAFQNIENFGIEFEGEFENGRPQMAVTVKPYGFRFHAGDMPANTSFDAIKQMQWKKLNLLARKCLEDLAQGERIFVCKSDFGPNDATEDMTRLAQIMRRYGPTELLWVSLAVPGKPAGTVERIADGLLHGYIDRFAQPVTLNNAMVTRLRRSYRSYSGQFQKLGGISVTLWLRLCCEAYRLHLDAGRQGTRSELVSAQAGAAR